MNASIEACVFLSIVDSQKAPSPGPSDRPLPQGEVRCGEIVPMHHLSLGGEVAARRRVRGPFSAL
ncbi:MAG: hypothetical protein BGO83_02770 [Devosia sp. 66-14]|nr:MAG: hypothetical protein BGO83_02770 [Devosia sp. 66-14]